MRCYGCMKEKTQSPVCEHCGFDENAKNEIHQLPIGTVLKEQYMVGKVLGQGGFGITYLGWDLYLDSPVAIKEYYPSGSVMRECTTSLEVKSYSGEVGAIFHSNRERFMNEAKALARFTKVPQIVQVHNFFLANNTAYIVMEFLEGVTLKDHIRKNGLLTMDQAMELLVPVMQALGKVHKSGIVHRDISPDNIMLLPDGGIKLLDFGAVREVHGAAPEKELAKSTVAILKQGFAPIEQYQARGALGPWTDVYAMTATLFYCLTGRVPPEATERLLDDEDLHLDRFLPTVSKDRHAAIEHGMALRAENRTASMEDLVAELTQAAPAAPMVEEIPMTTPIVEPINTVKKRGKETEERTMSSAKTQGDSVKPEKKERPKWWLVIAAAALVVVLLVSSLGGSDPSNNILVSGAPEEGAELSEQFLSTGLNRDQISSITFLDTLEEAPEGAVDVSEAQDGKVLAWSVPNEDDYDLYIAGKGGVAAPANCSRLFAEMALQTITFNGAFDTSNVTDMSYMFYNARIAEIDFSCFDTSGVTNMSGMFMSCWGFTKLDLSGFNTSNVTDMGEMFSECGNLTELNVSGFNTSNVTNMFDMFGGCEKLTALNVSNFDTSNVTNMSEMFRDCASLTELDLSGFDTSNVTDMYKMFAGCLTLAELDVSNFDTSLVTNMERMFAVGLESTGLVRNGGSDSLKKLDISGFDTSNVTTMESMFSYCRGLTELNVSGFDTSNVTNMESMFANCESVTTLDVSGFDTSNVTDMGWMFHDCYALKDLDVSGFDFSNVTNAYKMFSSWDDLPANVRTWLAANVLMSDVPEGSGNKEVGDEMKSYSEDEFLRTGLMRKLIRSITIDDSLEDAPEDAVNVSEAENGKVVAWFERNGDLYDVYIAAPGGVIAPENCQELFAYMPKLVSISLYAFDTTHVTNMSGMFRWDSALTDASVYDFETRNVTDMSFMFFCCCSLPELDVSNFDTSNVTDMSNMFHRCDIVEKLNVRSFDTSKVTNMNSMFGRCNTLTKLDVSGFDTSNVTNMAAMFSDCQSLTELDVSGFDTSNVTNMVQMFHACYSLKELDVSGFDTSNVTKMTWMFRFCRGLTELDVSSFDTSNVTDMGWMFSYCSGLTKLDVSGFDTANVTNMSYMFTGCSALVNLEMARFDMSAVEFKNINLEEVSRDTYVDWMFDGCTSLSPSVKNSLK